MTSLPFYIGSYSIPSPWTDTPDAHGAGISSAVLDTATGEMRLTGSIGETNPSFLVADPARRRLWAITEPEFGGDVIAYAADGTASLSELGRAASGADAPCHLTIDDDLAFVSHYHGRSVAVVHLDPQGIPLASASVTEPPTIVRGEDRGAEAPRPHSTVRIGDDELLVADAGRDQVLLYRVDARGGTLALLDSLALPTGTGPRHLAWRPESSRAWVSDQNIGAVTLVRRIAGPRLELVATVPAPGLGRARRFPSEIAIHPTAEVVYMANRHDDSLSIFSVAGSGEPQLIDSIDVAGVNPRHFALTPDGSMLLVTNQDSDDITSFSVSADGRSVAWTGNRLEVATPTSVAFWA